MGLLPSFYSALVGFFAFAAIYHLILWISSRREILLVVFSAECGLLALLSGVLVTLVSAKTPEAAQNAIWARYSIGTLVTTTLLWNMSLVSGVSARWFLWPVSWLMPVVFVIHTFVFPLNAPVAAVEQYELPWGEIVSNARFASAGWWAVPIILLTLACYLYCLVCGYHVWRRHRVAGALTLVTILGMILNIILELLRGTGKLTYPAYLGVVFMVLWVCVIAIQIADERRRTRSQLLESEQRFRGIFDQTFQFIGLLKTDGTLIEANRTALDFAGLQEEDVIGKPFWETVWWSHSPDLRDRLRQAIKDSAGGRVVRFEATHISPEGNLAYVDFSIKPVRDAHGEIIMLIPEGRDITERNLIHAELAGSRQRLEALSRQLITTQESERRHLARELHDEIGQVLSAIKMNLRRSQRTADTDVKELLNENVQMVDQAIDQVRSLSLSLRPPQLDELGLIAALHWLVKQQGKSGDFQVHLDAALDEVQVPVDLGIVCYRICQEALTNAVKHGMPRNVYVSLSVTDNELHLTIRDDGIGFDFVGANERSSEGASLGLISMHERASLTGGRIEVVSRPGYGTSIHAWWPLSSMRA